MSAGTPNQLRPVPPSHTGAELAPNLGPRWLGKSGFIELAPVFGPPELGKSRIIG